MSTPSMGGEILHAGLFKKMKTMRKKWFVVRAETCDTAARLEYYDSQKRFKAGEVAKRSIPLRTCFNINKRQDTKHKHVLALYTKDDCFCILMKSEEQCDEWLRTMLRLQHGEDSLDGDMPRPTYEHIWKVTTMKRGLGIGRTGDYRLCLSNKTVTLIKMDHTQYTMVFRTSCMRSCGVLERYIFLELGRSSVLGSGELWLEAEDSNIAHSIHATMFAMYRFGDIRFRTSSATESSKPSKPGKKQLGFLKTGFFGGGGGGGGGGTQLFPPLGLLICHQRTQSLPLAGDHRPPAQAAQPQPRAAGKRFFGFKSRDRCDSMPARRPRTASESARAAAAGRPWPGGQARAAAQQTTPPSDSSTDGSSLSVAQEESDEEGGDEGRYGQPPAGRVTPEGTIEEEEGGEPKGGGKTDGYVEMQPQSATAAAAVDDGYVEMSPRLRPHWLHIAGMNCGTPSTDPRFSSYPLEKVTSYITDADAATRPIRAYSVGSRPPPEGALPHGPAPSAAPTLKDDARARSFSTGCKALKRPGRVLPHFASHSSAGGKACSVPILHNSSRILPYHDDSDPMDNLMEMDFTRNSKTPSGYVEMKPGVEIVPRRGANSDDPRSGYMDMSGSTPPVGGHNDDHPFIDINRQYNNKTTPTSTTPTSSNNNYVDMSRRRGDSFCSQASTSPRAAETPDGYVDMTPGKKTTAAQASTNSEDYLNMSCGSRSKPTKGKSASQPISIQPKGGISALFSRKSSAGTSPKMHLPLNSLNSSSPYGSLTRQREPREGVFSTSPISPTRPHKAETSSALKIPAAILNAIYKGGAVRTNSSANSEDYAMMDFEGKKGKENKMSRFFGGGHRATKKTADYVNYTPAPQRSSPSDLDDGYTMMRPGEGAPAARTPPPAPAAHPMGSIAEDEAVPPKEKKDAPHPEDSAAGQAGATPSVECVSPAAKISRPNASDHAASSPPEGGDGRAEQQPPVDDKLHYASLDLAHAAEDGDANSRAFQKRGSPGGAEEPPAPQGEQTFVYAEIDFMKSEGLKQQNANSNQSLLHNAKVKH